MEFNALLLSISRFFGNTAQENSKEICYEASDYLQMYDESVKTVRAARGLTSTLWFLYNDPVIFYALLHIHLVAFIISRRNFTENSKG